MATTTQTATGVVDGTTVTLQTTAVTEADDTLEFSASLSGYGSPQDINIATVIDISGSTGQSSGSDIDGDGVIDSILDAQIAAAKALFQSYLDAGYQGDQVEVTLIVYNGSATTLGTFTLDEQSAHDVALEGLTTSGQTNFGGALQEIIAAWDATALDADPNNDVTGADANHILFMSDGGTTGNKNLSDELAVLQTVYNAQISAIGVGSGSNIGQLEVIDTTGGAVQVTDLGQLAEAVLSPAPALQSLVGIEIFIDGVSYGSFAPGDGALIQTPTGYTLSTTALNGYPFRPGETLDFQAFATFSGGEVLTTSHSVLMPFLVCFAEGTLIQTPNGERPVETLKPGDRVTLATGEALPLIWVGKRTLSADALDKHQGARPIRIGAGTFGPDRPTRDLYLSKQHRVFVDGPFVAQMLGEADGVLAPAHALANGITIETTHPGEAITYYHIAFDRHALVIANGLTCESLHVCARSASRLSAEARTALTRLFPGLRAAIERGDLDYAAAKPAARLLTAREGRRLAPFFAVTPQAMTPAPVRGVRLR